MENLSNSNQVEEVDIYGEDEEYEYFETEEQKMRVEIVKIGQPWNVPVDINDSKADEIIRKQGQDALRLQQLKESLERMVNNK